MNLTTLKSLQQRIRDSKGADRELDKAIADALRWPFPGWLSFEEHRAKHGYDTAWVAHSNWINDGVTKGAQTPAWTTDPDGLGACVGLMREVLPGYDREVLARPGRAYIALNRKGFTAKSYEFHDLETHAHLLAIIAACIAKLEAEQNKEAV